jgi:hypothetical protein
MSVPEKLPEGNPVPIDDPIESTPNSAASAAGILRKFVDGAAFVTWNAMDVDIMASADRTVVIASMLLSIATSLERIADALEAA